MFSSMIRSASQRMFARAAATTSSAPAAAAFHTSRALNIRIGDTAPEFACDSSLGQIDSFNEWRGDDWVLLVTHPADCE
jgi:hypothetical protein